MYFTQRQYRWGRREIVIGSIWWISEQVLLTWLCARILVAARRKLSSQPLAGELIRGNVAQIFWCFRIFPAHQSSPRRRDNLPDASVHLCSIVGSLTFFTDACKAAGFQDLDWHLSCIVRRYAVAVVRCSKHWLQQRLCVHAMCWIHCVLLPFTSILYDSLHASFRSCCFLVVTYYRALGWGWVCVCVVQNSRGSWVPNVCNLYNLFGKKNAFSLQ